MSDNAKKLAEELNEKLDSIHDLTISDKPFLWSRSEADIKLRSKVLNDIAEKLSTYEYRSKSSTVWKLIIYGVFLPLGILGILIWLGIPTDLARLIIWGGLGVLALAFVIAAAVIGHIPSLDDGIMLAIYTVPRGWSFSQMNSEETWEVYHKRFSYFDQGDENQYIGTRIWGFMDKETKQSFQMLHFHYDTVTYVPVSTGKTVVMQRVVTPHEKYGMFLAIPECRIRFRISEIGEDDGLKRHIKLEYEKLNKAVDVYCGPQDELKVRQFLSPAVEEVIMELSKELPDMLLDFYPGFVLIVTSHDFFSEVGGLKLNKEAPRFKELVQPAIDLIEQFRTFIGTEFNQIQKYNDNY